MGLPAAIATTTAKVLFNAFFFFPFLQHGIVL